MAAGILASIIGSLWGAVAGYLGGAVDAVMMRVVDAGFAIPAIVLLLLLTVRLHAVAGAADPRDRGHFLAEHRAGWSAEPR